MKTSIDQSRIGSGYFLKGFQEWRWLMQLCHSLSFPSSPAGEQIEISCTGQGVESFSSVPDGSVLADAWKRGISYQLVPVNQKPATHAHRNSLIKEVGKTDNYIYQKMMLAILLLIGGLITQMVPKNRVVS